MDQIEKLWPIIQNAGAVAAVVFYLWLRDVKVDRDKLAEKLDRVTQELVAVTGTATAIVEKNTAAWNTQSELVRAALERKP